MNIFVLDKDPIIAARYHGNKHVISQIKETAQILSTIHRLYYNHCETFFLYKKTHVNHPVTKWARTTRQNYLWTCKYGLALCKEYTYRYGRTHKSQSIITFCSKNIPTQLPNSRLTPFVQAMPEQYRCTDPIEAYRRYYNKDKRHLFTWKNRQKPHWIKEQ